MLKTNRFSLHPILVRHYGAMKDKEARFLPLPTFFALIGGPILAGGLITLTGMKISLSALTPALAAMGVLAGAFLSGFVLLMNTRMKIRDDESLKFQHGLARLVGQTAVTALYLVVACVCIIIIGMIMAFAWAVLSRGDSLGLSLATGLLVAGLAHVVVTGLTFVRRLFGVYDHLFRSDFVTELHPGQQTKQD